MARHRTELPQREDRLFLTDGGLETTLIFLEGHELPYFAAFDLINSEHGRNALLAYYRSYLSIAAAHGLTLPPALDKDAVESAGRVSGWVCEGVSCLPPVFELDGLEQLLSHKR